MVRDGLCPWARDIAKSVEHGVGEVRMAARAPPEMHDRVVVPDHRNCLDEFRRRKAREFVVERVPDPGVASQPEGDRGQTAICGRSVEEARAEAISGNVRPGRESATLH